jgi:hypothetical protein
MRPARGQSVQIIQLRMFTLMDCPVSRFYIEKFLELFFSNMHEISLLYCDYHFVIELRTVSQLVRTKR